MKLSLSAFTPSFFLLTSSTARSAIFALVLAPAQAVAAQNEDTLTKVPAALEGTRFQAAFVIRQESAGRIDSDMTVTAGDFTMRGPIVSTLRPVASSFAGQVVFAPDAIYHGELRQDEQNRGVKWLNEVAGRAPLKIDSVAAFDWKRGHLICLDRQNNWYRYDVKRRRFVDRIQLPGRAVCLVYDRERDAILALGPVVGTRSRLPPAPSRPQSRPMLSTDSRFDIFSVEGKHEGSLAIQTSMTDPDGIQAVWHRGHVVLISPAICSVGKPIQPGRIEAIDSKTGELVYRSDIRPLADDGNAVEWWGHATAEGDGVVPTSQHWAKRVSAIAEKLSKEGREDLADRIEEFREYSAGLRPKQRGGPSQIHAVKIRRSVNGKSDPVFHVTIRVTDQGRPIRLLLHADGPTHWQFEVAAGARLSEVNITETATPQIDGLPKSTRLLHWQPGDKGLPRLSNDADLFSSQSRAALGAQPMTVRIFQGDLDTLPRVIEIGPGDAAWKQQFVAALNRDIAARLEMARLASRTFSAAFPRAERQAGSQRALDDSFLLPSELAGSVHGDFTVRGPTDKVVASPNVRAAFVVNAGPGNRYLADLHQVLRVDEATGKLVPLGRQGVEVEVGASFPREKGSISGLAYDAKRKELVAAFNFDRRPTLYRWNGAARNWERFVQFGTPSAGLTYDPRHDLYYSLGEPSSAHLRRQYVQVIVMTRLCAPIAIFKLSVPVAQSYFAGPAQLVMVDDRLVVITPTHERFGEPGVNASEIYIVDPLNGKTHFAGAFQVAP